MSRSLPFPAARPVAMLAVLILVVVAFPGEAEPRSSLVGSPAPEIQLAGGVGVGSGTTLAALRGRPVLLVFFNPGCVRCRNFMPIVDRMHRRYGPQGLETIAITSRSVSEARRYLHQRGFSFDIGVDAGGRTQARYGVTGYPTTFIIGRDGNVKPLVGGKYYLTIEAELRSGRS